MKNKIFINFVVFLGVFLASWLFLGKIFVLNFAFAFLSFVLVILAVFYAQKRKINALIANADSKELEAISKMYESKAQKLEEELWQEDEEDNKESLEEKIEEISKNKEKDKIKIPKKRRFWQNFDKTSSKLGVKMFFMPLRLLAYAFLVVGFLILLKNEALHLWGFFSGLVFANGVVILNVVLWKIK
ncbi:hypothetical protein B6S12_07075 [Helicobacter valdiviensis]|uniref:Uncharacterized protein n=1 Tax=Helicobacter valdiviensis TaxID=1458358 RepID=A0A2W6MV57_9HELI|nr:hypothetical protein [Helicobacter valdiviensis]PZT47841.1 hypothetical protein B6S12_07075 [Helicobacter valdiviensis]